MTMENKLKTVAKSAGILVIGLFAANLLGLFEQILFGRIMGPENYGAFNLGITLIMMLMVIAPLGLKSAIVQFIPHNLSEKRNDRVVGALKFTFKYYVFSGIILAIALYILSETIALKVFHNSSLEMVIKVLSVSIVFINIYNWGNSVSQAFKNAKYSVYFNYLLLKTTEIIVFVLSVFLFGQVLEGALVGYIVGAVVAASGYLFVVFRKFIPSIDYSTENNKIKKELFSIGLPLFFAGFTYLFMSYSDKIILGIYTSTTDVGIFTASYAIASMTLFILPAFEYIFLPIVAELYGERDFKGINEIFKAVSKWVYLLTLPLVVYLILYPEQVISLIYGNKYVMGSMTLVILSLGIAMNGLTGLTGNVLVGTRRTRLNLLAEISGAVSNICLNILLIPAFGIVGAAAGTSISISVRNLFYLGMVYREFKIHPYDISYLKITLLVVVIMASTSFLLKIVFNNYVFLITVPIFIMLYSISLLKLNLLNKNDKMIINNVFIKLGLGKILLKLHPYLT